MLHDPAEVRSAFAAAAHTFLATIEDIADDAWDRAGALGEWTVRQLAGHTLRAFSTIDTYLGAEKTSDRLIADTAEYYRTTLGDPAIHASVAQRGRDAGALLTDPVGESQATSQRVLALIASTLDEDVVNTFAGQITFSEYLATRVVELGVHTLDLQRASGQLVGLTDETSTLIIAVLAELAPPSQLILALSGRAALPAGFNVLG